MVAVARKLAVLIWHLLTREEDYAFARPSLVRENVRRLKLAVGAVRRVGSRSPVRIFATPAQRQLERELGVQAEKVYRRLVANFNATRKKGAGAATGARISSALEGQAARQGHAPYPAL